MDVMESLKDNGDGNDVEVDSESHMKIIAVALDPRYKMRYVEWLVRSSYDSENATLLSSKIRVALQDLVDFYASSQPKAKKVDHGTFSSCSAGDKFTKPIGIDNEEGGRQAALGWPSGSGKERDEEGLRLRRKGHRSKERRLPVEGPMVLLTTPNVLKATNLLLYDVMSYRRTNTSISWQTLILFLVSTLLHKRISTPWVVEGSARVVKGSTGVVIGRREREEREEEGWLSSGVGAAEGGARVVVGQH
ncbi:hypothetical protein Cgig2_032066 [Carnegiea gigantea]|uniref:hAT-like transposase RNase-H fold domain-containing protein n=1 Tax=Carnegiea gigantea TaxID=171969 RepID=A0A9Q1JZS1_9CARY|nr:hypothetical protein Cgig2_032066 [Carnegiea gigantea]